MVDRLVNWFERVDLRRFGIGIGAAIVAVGAVAAVQVAQMHYDLGGPRVRGFYLDGEKNVPTAFSVALVAVAALLSFVLAARTSGRPRRGVLVAFGCLLTFLGLDDALEVHERLEAWAGVDWQILYAPLAVLGGGLLVMVARELEGSRRARMLLLLAVAAWAVAQVVELVQNASGELTHEWTLVPEETLEMTGSALFAFALLTTLQDLARRPPQSVG